MSQNDFTGHTLGQYTITERLGRGGMADVYKAFHPKLEVYRAVKVIRPEFVTASDFRERFQKEAQAVAALRHTNIVQIHDFGEQDDAYYMVMEFVEGQDLKRIIKSEGKIRPIRRALQIVDQVADALHYAHSRGLIHRDIKPENIMINEDGLPILMDFGIAKLLTANTQLTQTGMGIGTPAYMAPEQAKALPEIGPTADIYSLSVVLYEMLTGQVPFSADTPMAVMLKAINDPTPMPRQFSSDISENLQQVLLKGTAKDPENRYSTARQFQKALADVMDDESEAEAEPAATAVMQTGEMAGSAEPAPADAATKASDKATKVRAKGGGGSRALGLVVLLLVLAGAGGAGAYFLWWQPAEREGRLADAALPAADSSEQPVASPDATGDQPVSRPGPEPATGDTSRDIPGAKDRVAGAETATAGEGAGPEVRTTDAATTAREPDELDGGMLTPGRYAEGRTSRGGQAVVYSLEAVAGQTIFLDVDDGEAATEFTLTAPDGGRRVFQSEGDYGPVTLDQDGTYSLEADPRGEGAAEFEFVIRQLDEPVIDGGAIALGQRKSGEIQVPGQQVKYTVPGETGQRMVFELAESSADTEFTLTAPDGETRIFTARDDHGPVTLDQSGSYTLTADPGGDALASFDFVLRPWQPPMTDGGAIQADRFVRDRFAVPGRAVAYRFDAGPGETVYFDYVDSQQRASRIDFTLTHANGGDRVFRTQGDHGPVTLDRGGSYRLVVDPHDDRVQGYEFVLWNLEPAQLDGGPVALGRNVEGKTSKPGQTVAYSFQGSAGQRIVFDHLESTEATDFLLTAPDGRTRVFETAGDFGPVTLDQSGRYTLVADPRQDWVSEFEFVVRPGGA